MTQTNQPPKRLSPFAPRAVELLLGASPAEHALLERATRLSRNQLLTPERLRDLYQPERKGGLFPYELLPHEHAVLDALWTQLERPAPDHWVSLVIPPVEVHDISRVDETINHDQAQDTDRAYRPELDVPQPGLQRVEQPYDGLTRIFRQTETKITERRTGNREAIHFDITQNHALELEVPDGHELVMIPKNKRRAAEGQKLSAGTHTMSPKAGIYLLETWRAGQRLETTELTVPKLGRKRTSISQYADYNLSTNGDPLPRVLTDVIDPKLVFHGKRYPTAVYTYDFRAERPEGLEEPELPRSPQLPLGRYRIHEDFVVEVLKNGVVRGQYKGEPPRPLPWRNRKTMRHNLDRDNQWEVVVSSNAKAFYGRSYMRADPNVPLDGSTRIS